MSVATHDALVPRLDDVCVAGESCTACGCEVPRGEAHVRRGPGDELVVRRVPEDHVEIVWRYRPWMALLSTPLTERRGAMPEFRRRDALALGWALGFVAQREAHL